MGLTNLKELRQVYLWFKQLFSEFPRTQRELAFGEEINFDVTWLSATIEKKTAGKLYFVNVDIPINIDQITAINQWHVSIGFMDGDIRHEIRISVDSINELIEIAKTLFAGTYDKKLEDAVVD